MAITSSLSDLNIMLVEPSTMQANMMRRMLEKLGATQIIHCPSGSAALDALGGISLPVMISSLYLPDMSGIDLVATLSEQTAS